MLDAERARELLDYSPETGDLTWRARPVVKHQDKAFNTRFAGKVTGCRVWYPSGGHYLQVGILGQVYLAHRLAWLITHGAWPKADIDHKDGDGCNNRLANLRQAERFENNQNRPISTRNKSGFPGVSAYKGGWRAQIALKGYNKFLGVFYTPEAAGAAYREAKARIHTFNPEVRR